MTGKIINNELGSIHISKETIATIAGLSAMECYGIVEWLHKSKRWHCRTIRG